MDKSSRDRRNLESTKQLSLIITCPHGEIVSLDNISTIREPTTMGSHLVCIEGEADNGIANTSLKQFSGNHGDIPRSFQRVPACHIPDTASFVALKVTIYI